MVGWAFLPRTAAGLQSVPAQRVGEPETVFLFLNVNAGMQCPLMHTLIGLAHIVFLLSVTGHVRPIPVSTVLALCTFHRTGFCSLHLNQPQRFMCPIYCNDTFVLI